MESVKQGDTVRALSGHQLTEGKEYEVLKVKHAREPGYSTFVDVLNDVGDVESYFDTRFELAVPPQPLTREQALSLPAGTVLKCINHRFGSSPLQLGSFYVLESAREAFSGDPDDAIVNVTGIAGGRYADQFAVVEGHPNVREELPATEPEEPELPETLVVIFDADGEPLNGIDADDVEELDLGGAEERVAATYVLQSVGKVKASKQAFVED